MTSIRICRTSCNRHDRLSMAASVELRVPFLENRLIDFAIHLPRRHKYRDKTGKWLLRKVAEKHIPRQNVQARKIGFEISSEFSAGTETLLRGGFLRDAMKWPTASVEDMIQLARREEPSRLRLVGMELFLRLHAGGETTGGAHRSPACRRPGQKLTLPPIPGRYPGAVDQREHRPG